MPSVNRLDDFITGLKHIPKGFSFLLLHPRLIFWAIIPTVINLAILGVMLGVFIHYYGDIYGWLTAHLGHLKIADPSAWYWHMLNAILWVADLILQVLVVLASLIILLVISYAAGLVIASPFNDALSEKVEVIASGYAPPPFSFGKFLADALMTARTEAGKAVVLISIPFVLLAINFIPVVGGLFYVILTFLCGAWGLGFAYADLPMGRRTRPLRERLAFAKRRRWALIGFGSVFAIPFFSLLFTAPMVVGGTLLYIECMGRTVEDMQK